MERPPAGGLIRVVSGRLVRWLQVPLTVRDPLRRADAIVVPGARVSPDGSLSRSGRERVATAARLHDAGWAPTILLTGGAPHGPFVEAEQMALQAEQLGIPRAALVLETASRNSRENAEFTASELKRRRMTDIILVTHAFHTRRMKRAFLRQGVTVQSHPVLESWIDAGEPLAFELLIREYIALAVDYTGGRR